jgi:hypothetical protein
MRVNPLPLMRLLQGWDLQPPTQLDLDHSFGRLWQRPAPGAAVDLEGKGIWIKPTFLGYEKFGIPLDALAQNTHQSSHSFLAEKLEGRRSLGGPDTSV